VKALLEQDFWRKQFLVALGALIFVLPYNLIITPMHLFSGNFTGLAQIVRSILVDYAHVALPTGFDITGIILYLINVPLLVLAYKKIGKVFFFKTIITVSLVALFFSIVPTPAEPIITDRLTGSLIAGIICGSGSGLILRSGSSGGGLDIIGMYFTKTRPNFSVGKSVMFVAAFVFTLCLFLYDFEIVVYSAIFTFTLSITVDRAHHQNVKVSAIIFTKNPDVASVIISDLSRGGTVWNGVGVYSHDPMIVYMTVVSRFEVSRLKREVQSLDPQAFIVVHNVADIEGFFQPHL